MTTPITDHEAQLLLTQKVDTMYREMKEGFANLQNNYATRMDTLEAAQNQADKVFMAKDIQDKKNDLFTSEIEVLQSWKSWTVGFGIGLTCLISLAGLLVAYIFTSHVTSTDKNIEAIQSLITNHVNQTK